MRIFEWSSEKELTPECAYFNFICALSLKVPFYLIHFLLYYYLFCQAHNEFILVGDLQRSMQVLHYKTVESSLDEMAKLVMVI